jgi:hypothetical protein
MHQTCNCQQWTLTAGDSGVWPFLDWRSWIGLLAAAFGRYYRSMRKSALIILGTLALALPGCQTRSPGAGASPPRAYTRIANPDAHTVQLQIALRKFVPSRRRGPAIWLASVMHVGEPAYYHALQRFLDAQTVVLYEGINPDSHPHHVHDSNVASAHAPPPATPTSGAKAGYSMQSTLAKSLGLVFQLEAVDYDRSNFLNSDLSVLQIQRVIAGEGPRGATGQKGGGNAPFETLLQIMDGSSFLGGLFKIGLQFIAASPQMQAVAKLTLIEAVGRLKGDLSDVQGLPPDWKQLIKVLIEARNQNLMADLKAELKKIPPSGSIAVFYGVGHMDDLEKRVTGDLHYRPADDTWLTAFSVDSSKSGLSPAEVQFIRNLIQGQVGQMRQF